VIRGTDDSTQEIVPTTKLDSIHKEGGNIRSFTDRISSTGKGLRADHSFHTGVEIIGKICARKEQETSPFPLVFKKSISNFFAPLGSRYDATQRTAGEKLKDFWHVGCNLSILRGQNKK